MKFIELTQGKQTIVDDEDFEWLNQWRWGSRESGKRFYAVRNGRINGKQSSIRMHREILSLEQRDGKIVDHKNRNGLDNRKCNLRLVTAVENNRNRVIFSNNVSGVSGIHWSKNHSKWQVRIGVKGIQIDLGRFKVKKDAIKVRKLAEEKYW